MSIVGFYAFAFGAVDNADDASSLLGFSNYNFQGVGGGSVDCADFRHLL